MHLPQSSQRTQRVFGAAVGAASAANNLSDRNEFAAEAAPTVAALLA